MYLDIFTKMDFLIEYRLSVDFNVVGSSCSEHQQRKQAFSRWEEKSAASAR